MPDEYGLPTAAEYAAEQEQLDREENRARFKQDVSTGAQVGAMFLPGIGTVAGGLVGGIKYGLGTIARAKDEVAESERERRLRALLRRAELGELVDPQELAAIEQQYMDPYLANQRAQQQAALQGVASQDMGAGSFARAEQARQASQAEETLKMANLIENQRREQEEAERKELAALVEGDIEGAQAAAEKAGKDADAAFNQFMTSVDPEELAETEWSKQFMEKLDAKNALTPAQMEAGRRAQTFWLGETSFGDFTYESEYQAPGALSYGDPSQFVKSLVGDGS